jgi:hypothetical protein
MWKTAALCGAVVAGLALVGSSDASAEVKKKVAPANSVRTNVTSTPARTNVVRTPARVINSNPGRTTNQIQNQKLGGTGAGSDPKFHKTTGPVGGNKVIAPVGGNKLIAPVGGTNVVGPANLKVSPGNLKLGPGKINPVALKPVTFPIVKLSNNKFAPVWKGPKQIWWGGKWKSFLPYSAIAVVVIGGSYFYPDAYVGFARPYCAGLTPDGCQLNWQMVNFEDGGGDWQCVQFCPRPNALPPPQAVALVAPPPVPQGTCEVTIYPDPSFAGAAVTTGDEQPALSQSGWQNQIASIEVKSGTWDFFTDENFTGQTMRLPPGPYQDLGPDWSKKIGSFMCVQPGS